MLLEIRQQKNGTIVLRAPDDSVYTFDLDGDKLPPEATLQKIGRTLLQILDDPDMPQSVVSSAGQVTQGAGFDPGKLEANIRQTMDSAVPGSSRILDFLQGISGGSDEEATG
jgi:hypothetical protein